MTPWPNATGRPASRFIVGAGCEVQRDTPPANLRALAECARMHSAA